jgi:hypothetical protein
MKTRSKSACELYRIWAKGHYAAISLDVWDNPDRSTFGGEILVHSSVGNFGGDFNSCAAPFKQFLLGVDMESFMSKCGGAVHLTFDGESSVNKVRAAILARRRARTLSAEAACELWSDIQFACDSAARSELSFRTTMTRMCNSTTVLGEPSGYVVRTASPPAQFFWTEIWPEFKAMLDDLIQHRQQLAA